MDKRVRVEYTRGAGVHLLHGRRLPNGEIQERIFWKGVPVEVDPQEAADLCATRGFRVVPDDEESET